MPACRSACNCWSAPAALRDEAWQAFADSLRAAPDGETAQLMQWLFAGYGLHSTRTLLENFVHKRAEWWAYTQGQDDAAAWATEQLQNELEVDDIDVDPLADWGMCDATAKSCCSHCAQAGWQRHADAEEQGE